MAAVTGEPGLETSAHAKEAGFDVHFGKPMEGRDIEMLLSRLNDVPADVKTDADSDPRRERLSAH